MEINVVYSTPIEETLGQGAELFREETKQDIDNDLGLPLVPEKPTIFEKYGVHCDPDKNSFHKSLFDQYQRKGYLSEKQINALR